jgi:hypothetical protein
MTRSIADFQTALRAGRVTYVIVGGGRSHLTDLRWSTSPLFWYRSQAGDYTRRDLTRDLGTAGARPVVRLPQSQGKGALPRWPFTVPVPRLGWTVRVAWLATFLIMLGTARPRLGNRWAWFWLFTVGSVGAVLFLYWEPRSLRRGLRPQEPPARPLSGGMGFTAAVCLHVVLPIFATLVLSKVLSALLS